MAPVLERKKKPRIPATALGEPMWGVASFYPTQGNWTELDYLALEKICGNCMIELANGCLEILPMPDLYHQRIVKWLLEKIDLFILPKELGEATMAPMPIRLFPGQLREPDILFFLKSRSLEPREPPTGADLVMEVVSPGEENRQRDLDIKRREYARAKIPEYWIVDPETKTITILVLSGRTYKVFGEHRAGTEAKSKILKGFRVLVDDVFAAGEAIP